LNKINGIVGRIQCIRLQKLAVFLAETAELTTKNRRKRFWMTHTRMSESYRLRIQLDEEVAGITGISFVSFIRSILFVYGEKAPKVR
jgi:hypothetical protein